MAMPASAHEPAAMGLTLACAALRKIGVQTEESEVDPPMCRPLATLLVIVGMANPVDSAGVLDVADRSGPSIAAVMAGAIAVGVFAYALARRRTSGLLGLPMPMPMPLPSNRVIDVRLIGGSLLFGIGWGLAGFRPGPAIVALGAGYA